jgi:hypothetical protein
VAKALTPCLLVIFPIFDAWKKAVFGQKRSFFPHFASTILTYFQNSGIS